MSVNVDVTGARHVYLTEGSEANRRVVQQFIMANKVQHKVTILAQDVSDTLLSQLVAPVSALSLCLCLSPGVCYTGVYSQYLIFSAECYVMTVECIFVYR